MAQGTLASTEPSPASRCCGYRIPATFVACQPWPLDAEHAGTGQAGFGGRERIRVPGEQCTPVAQKMTVQKARCSRGRSSCRAWGKLAQEEETAKGAENQEVSGPQWGIAGAPKVQPTLCL